MIVACSAPAALVHRIRGGDAAAEGELVDRFRRGLTLMLRRLGQDATLAEDLCQETLCLVLQKIRRGEVRDPECLAGFIRSTARNLFIANRRRERRYRTGGDDENAPAAGGAGGGRDAAAAPLAAAIAAEEARLVRRLLAELRSDRDRELLVRFYLSDESREEVCRRLDIDPQRFHQVLHRARQRLRELWERAERGERLRAVAVRRHMSGEEMPAARTTMARGGRYA